jgi:biotin operon repressor
LSTDNRDAVLEDLVAFYKALSDRTRLRIVGLLAARPRYVQELADTLGVSAPTVSHHLFRLRAAGLVASGRRNNQVHYRLETDRIERLSRALLASPAARPPENERERVLRAFFDGDRLRQLPTAQRKRLVVLEEVARRFTPGRRYTEREVDAVLKGIYHDHCTVRRALIDHRLMTRDGGIYERRPASASPPAAS